MRRRYGFIPSAYDVLEGRLVLSHGATGRGLSVVVSGLSPRHQVLNSHQQPIVAEVNQAFDSFESDYGQARAAYSASVLNQSPTGGATTDALNAFKLYTIQRVSLLSQQLISSFLQVPQGTSRTPGRQETLKPLITNQIINTRTINVPGKPPSGLLIVSLLNTIPTAGASASTASLYALSQDNAVESARVTVINALNIVKNSDFGNQFSKHNSH